MGFVVTRRTGLLFAGLAALVVVVAVLAMTIGGGAGATNRSAEGVEITASAEASTDGLFGEDEASEDADGAGGEDGEEDGEESAQSRFADPSTCVPAAAGEDADGDDTDEVRGCPPPIADPTVTAGVHSLTLSWTPGTVPAGDDRYGPSTAYFVMISGGGNGIRELETTETSVTFDGLRNITEPYRLVAWSANDAGTSRPIAIVRGTPLTAPDDVVSALLIQFADGKGFRDLDVERLRPFVPDDIREAREDGADPQRDDGSQRIAFQGPLTMAEMTALAQALAADPAVVWAKPEPVAQ